MALLRDNLLAKACSSLKNEPPAEVTASVIEEMTNKHPDPRLEDISGRADLRPISAAAAQVVDIEAVSDAVYSFARGSSGGPSGLKPQHLKDAFVPGWRDEVARQLTTVVNVLAQGRAPAHVQPWLCGANLVALRKPSGDLRPVASGEV